MRNPQHPLGLTHKLSGYKDDVCLGLVAVGGLRHGDGGASLVRNLCVASLLDHGAALFDDVSCLLGLGDETAMKSVVLTFSTECRTHPTAPMNMLPPSFLTSSLMRAAIRVW